MDAGEDEEKRSNTLKMACLSHAIDLWEKDALAVGAEQRTSFTLFHESALGEREGVPVVETGVYSTIIRHQDWGFLVTDDGSDPSIRFAFHFPYEKLDYEKLNEASPPFA